MAAADTAALLSGFRRRGAGTNSERLAAVWLRDEIASPRREAWIETFWCRPGWALAHGWHALLGVAGSLIAVSDARLGGALLIVAVLSIAVDWFTGRSPGRRLSPEHASQNVVSRPTTPATSQLGTAPATHASPASAPIHLIVTANYDAGRVGLAYRPSLRRAAAAARRFADGGRFTPGWLGWLAIELVWLLVVAILRNGGATGSAIGVVQLLPTVGLVLELALLLELAASDYGPAASDNAAGAAVALALVKALDTAPPRHLTVELVLTGAGDGQMIGLARHLRARRRELAPGNAVVLGIGPCGSGTPRWWTGDGNLVPLRYHRRMGQLVASLADEPFGPEAIAYRGRGCAPALPARRAGIPAINLGSLDDRGLAPRSHLAGDTPDALDPGAMDAVLGLALLLVDALDADVARAAANAPAEPQPSTPAAAHL
jgi:hypothetical protein